MLSIEAEEAQSKIEELKDQEYNERRSALLNANDIEMSELLRQKQDHLKEFELNWNEHEKQLAASARSDVEALEGTQIR